MTRKIEVDLDDLLDLVHAAEDYGWGSVFLCSIAGLIGPVTEEEVEAFAVQFLTPEMQAKGYGEEDADAARERLTAFRKRYCSVPQRGEDR